jgi:hypothetical protein
MSSQAQTGGAVIDAASVFELDRAPEVGAE